MGSSPPVPPSRECSVPCLWWREVWPGLTPISTLEHTPVLHQAVDPPHVRAEPPCLKLKLYTGLEPPAPGDLVHEVGAEGDGGVPRRFHHCLHEHQELHVHGGKVGGMNVIEGTLFVDRMNHLDWKEDDRPVLVTSLSQRVNLCGDFQLPKNR